MKNEIEQTEQEKINKVYELRSQELSRRKICDLTGYAVRFVYKHMKMYDTENAGLIAKKKAKLVSKIVSLSKKGIPGYKIAEIVGIERRNVLRILKENSTKVVYSNCKAIEKDLAEVFSQKNGISEKQYKAIIEFNMNISKSHEEYKTKLSETMKNTKTKFKRSSTQRRLGLDSKHIIWIPDYAYNRSSAQIRKMQELTNEIMKDREELQEKMRAEALAYNKQESSKIKEKIQNISYSDQQSEFDLNSSVISFNNMLQTLDNKKQPWFARNDKKALAKAVEYAKYKENLKISIKPY